MRGTPDIRPGPRSAQTVHRLRLGRLAWVVGGALLLAAPSSALGEKTIRLTLAEKVFQAEGIVEVNLPMDQSIPKHSSATAADPKGHALPRAVFERAMKGAKIERVLKPFPGGKQPPLPKQIYVFAIQSPCWWKAYRQGSLRSLVFLRRDVRGRYEDSGGVEHEDGLYSDLNPDYDKLVKAIQEVASWSPGTAEDNDRAAQQKILMASHDPYQLYLTVQFLNRYAPDVLDETWGAKGAPERMQYDRIVSEPATPVCQAAPSADEK
ncbi:MAG: hypothetical protein KGO52_02860 [Nitrospirota bacterium]|nr:hypothetical protein [Nitrospirota bacterium]MDE3119053.1 hypothetical protein [Nitrospirota bacterium]MDE3224827.1 hypothetical protein [Nitrospirota bacterium]MDE3241644.1 hypothetical protein [Nitrospirota bacterium]